MPVIAPPAARTLVYYRDLIAVLLAKEFKVRYKSTFMGYAWSVMHPLVLAMIFFAIFRVMMRFEIPDYALYLIAGLFAWQGWRFWESHLGHGNLALKLGAVFVPAILAGLAYLLAAWLLKIPAARELTGFALAKFKRFK